MYTYITKKLLGFKDPNIIIKDFNELNNQVIIDIELKPQTQICPNCKKHTNSIHDYRYRTFKHGKVNEYYLIVNYKRRRYKCFSCNKQFPERNLFVDRYAKISNQLNNILINNLKNVKTFKQIAKENNVSSSTVIRRFDKHFTHIKKALPEYLSFDEFKKSNSNSKSGKYALAIADPVNKKIIDIIGNRRKTEFESYLKTLPKEALSSVKVIIIDMWEPYRDLIYKYFPNAKIVIDRFHYIRNIIWALNDVRIRTMNNYSSNQKGYSVLKKHYKLLNKNPDKINHFFSPNKYFKKLMSESSIIKECLSVSAELSEAYQLYAYFQTSTNKLFETYDEAILFINEYVNKMFNSKIPEFYNLAKLFINWKKEIAFSLCLENTNSNNKRYTNGFIEGVNNFIKTFRRMSYNIRDFNRFKTRIISTFNQEFMIKA